jgi:hypothetical protein
MELLKIWVVISGIMMIAIREVRGCPGNMVRMNVQDLKTQDTGLFLEPSLRAGSKEFYGEPYLERTG